jgi:hypothetical protein
MERYIYRGVQYIYTINLLTAQTRLNRSKPIGDRQKPAIDSRAICKIGAVKKRLRLAVYLHHSHEVAISKLFKASSTQNT